MLRRLALLAMLFSTLTLAVKAEDIFAVTTDGKLIRFDSAAPETILSTATISGLQPNETILGIDFKHLDGKLYALGSTSRLYTINVVSGAATAIGTGSPPPAFTPALSGTRFAFDFNPSAAGTGTNVVTGTGTLIRVVSDTAQNLRINSLTGTIEGGAAQLSPSYASNGLTGTPQITGAAYSNNFTGASTTTLYVIDSSKDSLFIQDTNTHGLTLVGPLGVDTSDTVGFDVSGPTGLAYAALQKTGNAKPTLYLISLNSGAAVEVGDINSTTSIVGISVPTAPTQIAYGRFGNTLRKFPLNFPSTQIGADIPITGLGAGDIIVGMDFRPRTGVLYALTSNANAGAELYTIDVATGAATSVTQVAIPGLPDLDANTNTQDYFFGVDFNPAADALRVVTNNGLNVRIRMSDNVVFIDSSIAPGAPIAYATGDVLAGNPASPVAAAYANNVDGTTTTTLYVIDFNNDTLCTQIPPNSGTLNTVAELRTVNAGNNIVLSTQQGDAFDIAPNGRAYFKSNNVLYQINLVGVPPVSPAILPTTFAVSQGATINGLNDFAIPTNVANSTTASGSIAFTAASFKVVEGSTASVQLTRTGGSNGFASVFVSTSGNASVNSATPGVDYTPLGVTVSFADGETTRTVFFEALTDSVLEVFESVNLTISNPVGCAIGTLSTTQAIIQDFDDRDGDGFTTAEELAAGTSDEDPSSTPFGGAPAGPANTTDLTVTKASFKLNFVAPATKPSDSISVTGSIANIGVTDLVALDKKNFVVNFGGVIKSLELGPKGSSLTKADKNDATRKFDKDNTVKVKKPKDGAVGFTVSLKKGDFDAALADEGLAADADNPSKAPRTVVFRVLFNGKRYEESLSLTVTIKPKGSSGKLTKN